MMPERIRPPVWGEFAPGERLQRGPFTDAIRAFFVIGSTSGSGTVRPQREATMPDLADGESLFMQGSGAKPYELKNTGGVYSCSCPAWRNQSLAIEKRTCKHLKKLRGETAEIARVGSAMPSPTAKDKTAADAKAAPVLLAESWDGQLDPAGWWISEKLDGVRAYWDGDKLLSRLGNVFHAPDWFIANLPKHPLDGELFLDRKSFQKTVAIVRRQDKSDHWKKIRFLIFDAPGEKAPFEQRLKLLESLAKHADRKSTRLNSSHLGI